MFLKKNLWKPDSYIILLNYHFCMLFTSGQRLHTEQRILYCYIYIIKSTWIMQLSILLHISSVSIFHFLYYKQWRGGTCIWPVIFLLQPVIWSPLSAWWHDVSAVSCTCHNKSVSLQFSRSFPGLSRQHCSPILHANICIHVALLQV